MKFVRLSLAGFRGVREPLTIDFGAGFSILCGPNGSGKTTVCDAIEFALTGAIARDFGETEKGETLANYLWWCGDGQPKQRYVRLVVADDAGRETTIERTADSVVTPSQKSLEDLLCVADLAPVDGLGEACRSMVLRGETIGLLSLEMKETDRFDFVRRAAGSPVYADLMTVLDSAASTLNDGLAAASQGYADARQQVGLLLGQMADAEPAAAEFEKGSADIAELRSLLKMPAASLDELLAAALSHLATWSAQLRASEAWSNAVGRFRGPEATGIPEARKRLAELQLKAKALEAQLDVTLRARAQRASQLSINQSASSRGVFLADLLHVGRAIGLVDGECPLCGSSVSPHAFEARLDYLARGLDARSAAISELGRVLKAGEQDDRQARTELNDIQRALQEMAADTARQTEAIARLEDQLRTLPVDDTASSSERIDSSSSSMAERLARLQRGLAVLQASVAVDKLADLRRSLAKAQELATAEAKKLARAEEAVEAIKRATDSLKRAAGELVYERLETLRPLLTELYGRLRPHTDWDTVDYKLRGDLRRFLRLIVGSNVNPRFVFSTGQRRTLGLAFLLSVHLARKWCRLNTLVLDDPVQHIDDFRALQLVEVLSGIRMRGQQIICTIEDAALADLLSRRLRSSPQEQGTRINLHYVAGEGIRVANDRDLPLGGPMVLEALGG